MSEYGVGRLLVASLHQGIADLLPARLEFYESWLNPTGMRDGRIGVAPLAAVLSFLRQEGKLYRLVAARAGEYTAEWTVADMPAYQRTLIRAAPVPVRVRMALRVARQLVQATFAETRAGVRIGDGRGAIDIRQSIFCWQVRDRVDSPLCEFHAAAVRRLLHLFSVEADVDAEQCRAAGSSQCVVAIALRSQTGTT